MLFKRFWYCSFLVALVGWGCNSHSSETYQFSDKMRAYLEFYKSNKIWCFSDSSSRTDTLQFISVDSSVFDPLGINMGAQVPHKDISILYRHISKTKRYQNRQDSIMDSFFILISKHLSDSVKKITIDLYDFEGESFSDSIGITKLDTIKIDNIEFTKYVDIGLLDDIKYEQQGHEKPTDITHVYWLNKYGIIAYRYRNGDIWKRINLSN